MELHITNVIKTILIAWNSVREVIKDDYETGRNR